ncbi:MAG TPA: tRNA (adenosine(37)-N6)-threonylcarbamoyltransferase complex dimerization subunit type 1 TsaB [Candidatus Limnocylindrales bacterium]
MSAERWLLAIDTATSRVIVAAGRPDGTVIAERAFAAEHRHGERLLATVDELATATGLALDGVAGVVVGTGPGAFTGLRVGLATAKTLAHELHVPIAGVSTAEALLAAPGGARSVWLPAGPNDRVLVAADEAPRLVTGPVTVTTGTGATDGASIAVDLDGRASAAESAAGRRALDGLATALLRLGQARLAAGGDDPERLVPEYVTLPRGIEGQLDLEAGVAWSRSRP